MPAAPASGSGTESDPWVLKTPSLGSEILMHKDEVNDPPVLVCTVGKTILHYDLRIVGGWYGLKKGLRGRVGNYVAPVLEVMGLAEVEHNPRNNPMRAT